MNLLVTGGAGFIGSHFVRSVLADALPGLAGARVTVLDKLTGTGGFANLGPVAEHERLNFIPGDIAETALIEAVLPGHDAVVHFAAERSEAFVTTNVLGTQVLLDAARRHGTSRYVQVSTDAVYGPISTGACTEQSPLAPTSPYAATRAAGDLLALAHHRTHGLPVVVTRSANTYGPYQHPGKLIPRFVTNLLTGRTVPLYGDGGQIRDWVHVDDHCRAIALALLKGEAGEIYHIGGSQELTNRELTGMLLAECGADWTQVATVENHNHDRRHSMDDQKIRQDLGYQPRTTLATGLAATVQWYRDNEEWWRPTVTE
jgi:dTDP-glucose 4,6-dehydratase